MDWFVYDVCMALHVGLLYSTRYANGLLCGFMHVGFCGVCSWACMWACVRKYMHMFISWEACGVHLRGLWAVYVNVRFRYDFLQWFPMSLNPAIQATDYQEPLCLAGSSLCGRSQLTELQVQSHPSAELASDVYS